MQCSTAISKKYISTCLAHFVSISPSPKKHGQRHGRGHGTRTFAKNLDTDKAGIRKIYLYMCVYVYEYCIHKQPKLTDTLVPMDDA